LLLADHVCWHASCGPGRVDQLNAEDHGAEVSRSGE
jgi:hypothetical protein